MKNIIILLSMLFVVGCKPYNNSEPQKSTLGENVDLKLIDSVRNGLDPFISPRSLKNEGHYPTGPISKYSYIYLQTKDSSYEKLQEAESEYSQLLGMKSTLDESTKMLFILDTLAKFRINKIRNIERRNELLKEYEFFHDEYKNKGQSYLKKKKEQDSVLYDFYEKISYIQISSALKYAQSKLYLLRLADSLKAEELENAKKMVKKLEVKYFDK